MPKRVLAIGVGGTGKAVLTILKERLVETYSQVPSNVVLLSLDTDDLRDIDTFAGSQLTAAFDERGREPEFQHIVSPAGMTMDTVFADITRGVTSAYMYWLEAEKLNRILSPVEKDIRGGAQQRRPVGRVATFLSWDTIYQHLINAITRVYGEPEEERAIDEVQKEKSKRLIFVVGSMAGGTGSGFFIDVMNLVRHAVQSNSNWQSIDVSGVVALPDVFQSYTKAMKDPTNLKPNSYAALRELDRFIRTHSSALPYMIRYGASDKSITWSFTQPLDHIYLVDTASRSASQDFNLGGDPMRGVFPVIADFVMAHVDESLGNALATLRSNAGQHYDKEEGWQYSSFNLMTYLLPVNDIIESFSYRFLRQMVARQYLPLLDNKTRVLLETDTATETEDIFSKNSVNNKVNPGVVAKAIAATRPIDPERPDASWPGLFNMIALSESAFAEDYQKLNQYMEYLTGNLIPTGEGDFKKEAYSDGYDRLQKFAEHFVERCLGRRYERDNEDARAGGDWDNLLGRYRNALRLRFAEAVDVALLEVMNKRDENKLLLANRLPVAQAMVGHLKKKLVAFKEVLQREYAQFDNDNRLRRTGEDLRNAIAWMQETKDTKTWALWGKPEARKAQDGYVGLFIEKMDLTLHRRLFNTVLDVLDALGAAEKDKDGNLSVLDEVALELEHWEATFAEVDKILARLSSAHEKNRDEKRRVKMRRYVTSPEFEDELYKQKEHSGRVRMRVIGQVSDQKGITWQRTDDRPLHYKMITVWTQEAVGAEEIACRFFAGVKELFQVVRQNVNVADRIAAEFKSPASFVNKVSEIKEQPFLRYQPASNGKEMFDERYLSFSLNKAVAEVSRRFMEQAMGHLSGQGVNIDTAAESQVACTVVEVARGARLRAIDQFIACEADYRFKLDRGRESLHLFPEEQVATDYEGRINTLGEGDNHQRPLSPELVIAMGDEAKLRNFVLACAIGLVEEGSYWDPEDHVERTEIFLDLAKADLNRRLLLSQSSTVLKTNPKVKVMDPRAQLAYLYLNALQNFILKVTQKPGLNLGLVTVQVDYLQRQGVSLGQIENPFTLPMSDVSRAIRNVLSGLGPTETEEPNRQRREAVNARRQAELLQPFLENKVNKDFKSHPDQRIKDMGTVMHLILQEEINTRRQRGTGG